jgi:hypothetical protein
MKSTTCVPEPGSHFRQMNGRSGAVSRSPWVAGGECLRHGDPIRWPNQPGHFLAIGHKDKGRPQLDLERSAQRPAATVLHLEVSDGGMRGQGYVLTHRLVYTGINPRH